MGNSWFYVGLYVFFNGFYMVFFMGFIGVFMGFIISYGFCLMISYMV